MSLQVWGDTFKVALSDLWGGVINILPLILVAVIVFGIGWIFGSLVCNAVSKLFRSLKIDEALRATGLEDVVKRSGYTLNSGKFVGELVRWFVVVVFLIVSLNIVGLSDVNMFLQGVVVGYLPQVIVAVLMLLVAAVVARASEKFITAGAKATNLGHANLLGHVAKWAIWITAIMTVLYQLGIAAPIIQTIITGVVFALALALGLSFGLGGRDAAKETIEKIKNNISHHSN